MHPSRLFHTQDVLNNLIPSVLFVHYLVPDRTLMHQLGTGRVIGPYSPCRIYSTIIVLIDKVHVRGTPDNLIQ